MIKRTIIAVPQGSCPYNAKVIPTSPTTILAIDTGPLPICQALPCYGPVRRRRRCR